MVTHRNCAELSLIDMVTEILCVCGERFYTPTIDDTIACFKCHRNYEVCITFRDFYVKDITHDPQT
jgi:Zn finger protein HypA/HybF involved in hydrogenase expression